jgi:hypothetical protein
MCRCSKHLWIENNERIQEEKIWRSHRHLPLWRRSRAYPIWNAPKMRNRPLGVYLRWGNPRDKSIHYPSPSSSTDSTPPLAWRSPADVAPQDPTPTTSTFNELWTSIWMSWDVAPQDPCPTTSTFNELWSSIWHLKIPAWMTCGARFELHCQAWLRGCFHMRWE